LLLTFNLYETPVLSKIVTLNNSCNEQILVVPSTIDTTQFD
jgi:hypothetical protein